MSNSAQHLDKTQQFKEKKGDTTETFTKPLSGQLICSILQQGCTSSENTLSTSLPQSLVRSDPVVSF